LKKVWWDQLPGEVQDSILEGIQDIDQGKVFTRDQVIQEANMDSDMEVAWSAKAKIIF
jgi:hypothetical protein